MSKSVTYDDVTAMSLVASFLEYGLYRQNSNVLLLMISCLLKHTSSVANVKRHGYNVTYIIYYDSVSMANRTIFKLDRKVAYRVERWGDNFLFFIHMNINNDRRKETRRRRYKVVHQRFSRLLGYGISTDINGTSINRLLPSEAVFTARRTPVK